MSRNALVLGTMVLALSSPIAADAQVNKAPVIEGWGQVIDPDGDCEVKVQGKKLTLTVPATNHNLNPNIGTNAPRVLRDVEGDFTVQVKVSGDFLPGEMATKPRGFPFNGAGLLLWHNEKNMLRLERNRWWRPDLRIHVCYPPLVEYYKDSQYLNTNPASTKEEFFKGPSTWLKLERRGDKVKAFFSHEGKEWQLAKEVTVDLPAKLAVGVAAVNSSNKPFVVDFEDFDLRPEK